MLKLLRDNYDETILKKYENELSHMKFLLNDSQMFIQHLTKKVDDKNVLIEDMIKLDSKRNLDLDSLKQQNDNLSKEIDVLCFKRNSELEIIKIQNDKLSKELDELRNIEKELRDTLQTKQKAIQELKKTVNELDDSLKKNTRDSDLINKNNIYEIKKLQTENTDLKQRMNYLDQERIQIAEALEISVNDGTMNNRALRKRKNELKKKVEELQCQIKKINEKIVPINFIGRSLGISKGNLIH